jgi:hypothetical protein
MAIIISEDSNKFSKKDLIPAGSHVARCYSMIVLGTLEEEFKGEKKLLKKIRITWELPNEVKVFKEENGEQPFVVSKEYTLSLADKSNLKAMIESWTGRKLLPEQLKALNLSNMLGKTCMISIIHKLAKNGNTYAEITGVFQLPKGTVCPPQSNPTVEFTVDAFDAEKFVFLPTFIQDKIKSSLEYQRLKLEDAPHANEEVDNVPEYGEPADMKEEDGDGIPF